MTDQYSQKSRFLDEKQLASRWAISVKTIQRWRWKGEGPPFLKFVGRVRYLLDDIELYENTHKFYSTAEKSPDAKSKDGLQYEENVDA